MPSGVYSYTYDTFGNLKSVTLPNTDVITYVLDGLHRRTGVKLNGTLQKQYVWQDQYRIVAELDGSNNVTAEFIYGDSINVPDYMKKSGNLYKIMTNHLGSVVAVVNTSTGSVAQQIVYDEFGNITSDSSPGFQPFGFAGGLYDNDTKLVHFNAREYDPETGRWMQKDPILFNGGDTNLYGYVLNDPVNFVDPEGKIGWCLAVDAGLGAGLFWLGTKSPFWPIRLVGAAAGLGISSIICPKELRSEVPTSNCNPDAQCCVGGAGGGGAGAGGGTGPNGNIPGL